MFWINIYIIPPIYGKAKKLAILLNVFTITHYRFRGQISENLLLKQVAKKSLDDRLARKSDFMAAGSWDRSVKQALYANAANLSVS